MSGCIFLTYLLSLIVPFAWSSATFSDIPEYYDYNRVSFTKLGSLADLQSRFFTNSRANTNVVVGVAKESCMADLLNCSAFKGIQVKYVCITLIYDCSFCYH